MIRSKRVRGSTYVLTTKPTVGLFLTTEAEGVLIDSGGGDATAGEILELLTREGITLRGIVNTHSHADHCGGNAALQAATGCAIVASPIAAAWMEYPLLLAMTLSGGGHPPAALQGRQLLPRPSRASAVVSGDFDLAGYHFSVLPTPGHLPGHLAIGTEDEVLFCGDAAFGESTLRRHRLMLMSEPERFVESLDALASAPAAALVLGHGGVLSSSAVHPLLEQNRQAVLAASALIARCATHPIDLEELTALVLKELQVRCGIGQYALFRATISGHLRWLEEQGIIAFSMVGTRLVVGPPMRAAPAAAASARTSVPQPPS